MNIFFKRLEAILSVELFVESESSFRVTNPLLLLGFEKDLQDIDHTAGVEDSAVLAE